MKESAGFSFPSVLGCLGSADRLKRRKHVGEDLKEATMGQGFQLIPT